MRWTIAVGCAAALMSPAAAWAEGDDGDAPAPTDQKPIDEKAIEGKPASKEKMKKKRGKEHLRVDLGMSIVPLGQSMTPYPHATVAAEAHMAGPSWWVLQGRWSYLEEEYDGFESSTLAIGGRTGPRFEVPVFDWLEVGGHILFAAEYIANDSIDWGSRYLSIGGVMGPSAHLRPTDFFGVRLGLDVFEAHHVWTLDPAVSSQSTRVGITASPTVDLTFTF